MSQAKTERRRSEITWNGEKINTSFEYQPRPIRCWDWAATLDNYDPTPWDADTPAIGPHQVAGNGESEMQAICDLIQSLWENYTG